MPRTALLPLALFLPVLVLSAADDVPLPEEIAALKPVDLTWSVKIPLRDGVKLSATLYKPSGAEQPLPVLFTLTPYNADTYHERAMYFARHGYAFVLIDTRGRGNSGGDFEPFVNEGRDGYDIVEWLAKQSWCNGKVGMWGGSYGAFNQWATLKEAPPHLTTIVPAAAGHPGIDFPGRGGIFMKYNVRWLTFTSGRTLNQKLFEDSDFWNLKYLDAYLRHVPLRELDRFVGNPSPIYQKWLTHRTPDAYWDATVPAAKDYARFDSPILTITGHYDANQPGALTYYRRHQERGSKAGRGKHYLIIGPWDHAGTRTPTPGVGGVPFGLASVLDLNQLHKQWYDWTMGDGPRPPFLKRRVAYYVSGAEEWRFADSLDTIPATPRKLYLGSFGGLANDVVRSGVLMLEPPDKLAPDRYIDDPLDVRPGKLEREEVKNYLTDQRYALSLFGNGLVYHSEQALQPTEIAGCVKLVAWLALDVPDTDFQVTLYEVRQDGASILLTQDRLRARYRESLRKESLVKPGAVERYEFNGFLFFARRLAIGSRLRLVIRAPNSIFWEKNYNSGGPVEQESRKDARVAHVTLYHDAEHPSYLEVPLLEP
jgi:putative CocE/NonD family hydrolase